LSGSKILSGEGKAIVIAVGKLSALGKIQNILSNEDEVFTPLQHKLEKIAEVFSLIIKGHWKIRPSFCYSYIFYSDHKDDCNRIGKIKWMERGDWCRSGRVFDYFNYCNRGGYSGRFTSCSHTFFSLFHK